MTLHKPTLKVNRLIVFQNGHSALDCTFHAGVNVIRGRNSSGKTTVMDLLAFSLGAEAIRWKPEALQCTTTMIEVELNGQVACLRREIDSALQRPLAIFWGPLGKALEAGTQKWELYPFRRTVHRISFSQALFNALEVPQAQGDGSSNLTMHQLLRVLYADQPSVHSPIFRLDNFDSPLTREMVGGYLCGVYDEDLYTAQLRTREIEALLSKQESELRSIFNVLGRSGQSANIESLGSKILDLEAKRDALHKHLVQLKENRQLSKKEATRLGERSEVLRQELNVARRRESEIKDKIQSLDLDVQDSMAFVKELELRLESLEDSRETRSFFGQMHFQFCPSCLSHLVPVETNAHHCNLCKTELSENPADTQLLRMRNELTIQIKESKSLIDGRVKEIESLRRELPQLNSQIQVLRREYTSVASSWSSDIESAVEEAARKLGTLDEEIRQAYEQQKLASVIADLQKRRDAMQAEAASLADKITSLEAQQESRKQEVAETIATAMMRLLKQDLPLQKEFIDPHSIMFDFVGNSVYVNGARNFSESSAVVLRHIFHLSLLTASMEKTYMRVPRFLMLDGIDDGGMEKERSHRLQEILVRECSTYQADFQLIFATSEINPELEGTDLVVGRAFSPDARSLNVN